MQDVMKFWDGIAPQYAKSPIKDIAAYEYTLARTKSYLKASDTVLELGCGTGGTALHLADAVAHLTATDLSDAMLDVGRNKIADTANVTFQRSDIAGAPEGPFDVVMTFNLIHLLRDTSAALAQVYQRLKPGGLFISKTPCNPTRRAPLGYNLLRLALPLAQLAGKAPYVNFMDVSDWDAKVSDAGFKIIEAGNHPAHPPARYLVARKI
ncbi:class I SAM-dependent methyltransferase [uncultured Roseovarius sp.]|uniref:class I SAM-dependent methyltransferase n=1 Tax=uncultured Roseovarius sp. TaxID=293344 RepID=UPI002606D748|nr:class I SAM-dependent methyltransferase [uncultured Roseovarius sp.]